MNQPLARFALLGLFVALVGGIAVMAYAPAAKGATYTEFRPGGDVVTGDHPGGAEVTRLPFRLAAGSTFSLDLRADKGSVFRPDIVVLGSDREPDLALGAALKLSKKGDRLTLKNWRPDSTGQRWIEVRSKDGAAGSWTLKTKHKPPTKAAGDVLFGDSGMATFHFDTAGGATASLKASATKGSAAPVFASISGPSGPLLADDVRTSPKGFSLVEFPLAQAGSYGLAMLGETGDGAVVKVSMKTPKPAPRTIDASEVVTRPVLLSVSPSAITAGPPTEFTLEADFVRAGASVVFRRTGVELTIQPGVISVTGTGLTFTTPTSSLTAGSYEVEVRNADGGLHSLPGALTVSNPVPAPVSVSPAEGYDDQVVRVSIFGSNFLQGGSVSLRKGPTTVPGTIITTTGSTIQADFDLTGLAIGAWDVVVVNPGTTETVLPAAFTVLHLIEFHVYAVSPATNSDGDPVAVTIEGIGFLEGATVRMEPSDESGNENVFGTDVVVESEDTITALFDFSSSSPGPWSLVVHLTDGREARLDDCFSTRGPVGDPLHVLDPGVPADAPMATAWNATRNESIVAWMEEDPRGIVLQWTVYAQRVSASGTALGTPVNLTFNYPLASKRTVTAGWDPDHDEYLVAWAEEATVTLTQNGQPHPNGKSTATVDQIYALRLSGADLTILGGRIHPSDHTAFPSTSKVRWYLDEFRNFRPSVAYDRANGQWVIAWMQEFDRTGTQANDDFNVFQRTINPVDGSLGSLMELGVSPYHEGDPTVVWDESRQRILTAWNARAGSDSAPLDILLSSGSGGVTVAQNGSGDDLADPRLTVDEKADRILLTWTRVPGKGTRVVEGQVLENADFSAVGEQTVLAEGSVDTLGAVPVWNDATSDVLVSWAEADLVNSLVAVKSRVFKIDGGKGPEALGKEIELSGGTGDEGGVSAHLARGTGEVMVFWFKTLYLLQDTGGYPGTVVPANGTVRGTEVWMRRHR